MNGLVPQTRQDEDERWSEVISLYKITRAFMEFEKTFSKYCVNGSVVLIGLPAAHSASMSTTSLFTPRFASKMERNLSTMSSTAAL